MPFDFSEERERTNEEMASQIAEVTKLTTAEIERLMPRKIDKAHLRTLINIVNSAASQNNKIAALRDNLGDVGGVLLRVLRLVV